MRLQPKSMITHINQEHVCDSVFLRTQFQLTYSSTSRVDSVNGLSKSYQLKAMWIPSTIGLQCIQRGTATVTSIMTKIIIIRLLHTFCAINIARNNFVFTSVHSCNLLLCIKLYQ